MYCCYEVRYSKYQPCLLIVRSSRFFSYVIFSQFLFSHILKINIMFSLSTLCNCIEALNDWHPRNCPDQELVIWVVKLVFGFQNSKYCQFYFRSNQLSFSFFKSLLTNGNVDGVTRIYSPNKLTHLFNGLFRIREVCINELLVRKSSICRGSAIRYIKTALRSLN